jgi:hypothetical protein
MLNIDRAANMDDYPHNPANYTCPGRGIKCLCWDIDRTILSSMQRKRIKPQTALTPGMAIAAALVIGISAWCWILTQWGLW